MNLLLQIILFFLTWFSLSANPPLAKVALANYAFSFPKAETDSLESELKIGVQNFARIGISENSFSQKAFFWESSVLEETRARMSVVVVNGAGSIVSKGGKVISKEINNVVESVFSNPNKFNHLIEGSSNSVHRWESLIPDRNSVYILDIVKETLQHGADELYNGFTLTKVASVTRNGVTKDVQITYAIVNGKLIPSNGWVKP